MKKISPCLWFDNQAEEAARFYASVFRASKLGNLTHYGKAAAAQSDRPEGSVLTADVEIMGLGLTLLNGGPVFKLNPSISLFVHCQSADELSRLWKELSVGGTERMPLGSYPWSSQYGWTADRFGVEWQLILSPESDFLAPALIFVKEKFGRCQEAIDQYFSLFPNSRVESLTRSEDGKSVMHCLLKLAGQPFVMMDGAGPHEFGFNDAFSLQVICDDQKEIDYFWDKLSAEGEIVECGWLRDKFGVSWQVSPYQLEEIQKDPVRSERMMVELLKMKKLDLAKLLAAADGN